MVSGRACLLLASLQLQVYIAIGLTMSKWRSTGLQT